MGKQKISKKRVALSVIFIGIVVVGIFSSILCYNQSNEESRTEGLRDIFRQRIFVEQILAFVEINIRPWGNFNSGKTSYGDMKFSGTPREYFWAIDRVWPYLAGVLSAFLFKKRRFEGQKE